MSSAAPLSPSVETLRLVASFLRSQGYNDTLSSLLREASSTDERLPGLIERPSTAFDSGHDLQDVVEEYIAGRLARSKLEDPTAPLVEEVKRLELKGKMPERVRMAIKDGTNVLTVTRGVLPKRTWDSAELRFRCEYIPCVFTTAVDRSLKVYSTDTFELLDSYSLPSPALAFAQHPHHEQSRFVVCATMEGSLAVIDLVTREVKAKVKDHSKYIVRAAWSPDGRFIATLGYDKLIHLYRFSTISSSSADTPALLDDELPDPLAAMPSVSLELAYSLTTKTNPEAAVFLPDSRFLVWSARDDHLLHYLEVPAEGEEPQWGSETYNLNENGDAFVSFSILSIALHPTLPLLSLQTSTTNARLLLYPYHSATRLFTLHTTAQQSEYFAPRQAWLPSGAGVVVNSEDGIVRLVDLQGRVRVAKGAHGPAAPLEEEQAEGGEVSEELRTERARARREADKGSSVIRDVEVLSGEEPAAEGWRVLSCGFDKTVKVMEMV